MTGNRRAPKGYPEPNRGKPKPRRATGPASPSRVPASGAAAGRRADDRPRPTTVRLEQSLAEGAADFSEPALSITDRRQLRRWRWQWLRKWQVWGVALVMTFSGVGVFSAVTLLKLPDLPNCAGIFWPTASASLRLYCAQLMAGRRTVDDLLGAIDLVNALPKDHPLRAEINQNIETWAREILTLGEETFQKGDLDKAVSIAHRIPDDTSARKLVDDQIKKWNDTWQKADNIYKQAEDALSQQNLRQAFLLATRLLDINNTYWRTTKYQELNTLITVTRQDSAKLDKAKGLAEQGGLSNLVAAIGLMQEIQPSSRLYGRSQQLVVEFGRDMLELAETALDKRDYNQALNIIRQIPEQAKLQDETRDFELLAEAQQQAWGGTVDDIETAIVKAQKLGQDRPLFGRAQQLISTWQLEIQDVTHLNLARQLAQPGAIGDLTAAIAEAKMIPPGNPRREEAQRAIDEWTASIQKIEDQPYLDRAQQLASDGTPNALQAAINEASRIRPGRALFQAANRQIDQWTNQIQRIQDQPYLDQAQQLANQGDLPGAIQVAERIGPGRALSDEAESNVRSWRDRLQRLQDQPYLDQARQLASEGRYSEAISIAQQIGSGRALSNAAQADIRSWRGETAGRQQLQQAEDIASVGTAPMLISAIQIANQIAADNPLRPEAEQKIDRWSLQILQIAQSQSQSNLREAIATAQSIPPQTQAYSTAQQQIQVWQRRLN